MSIFTLGLILFVLSAVLTGLIRRYSLHLSLLDIPNQRSSHTHPTPSGGGLSIVICLSLGVIYLSQFSPHFDLDTGLVTALLLGGGLVAAVGFYDDHREVAARWRILVHILAVVFALFSISALPVIPLFGYELKLGGFGYLFYGLCLLWVLNLYNFMDGIDGIASVEAITVAGGAAGVLFLNGQTGYAALLVLLACSVAGFLLWNWPPAKIFMGDVASGYLGFVLGVFAIVTSSSGALNIWSWVILLGVFLSDATLTLFRRILRGERWFLPHRSHAYQMISRKLGSHKKVTVGVLCINVFWLYPWALLSSQFPDWALLSALIAILPLLILSYLSGLEGSASDNH